MVYRQGRIGEVREAELEGVDGVSFFHTEGETLGLVGESRMRQVHRRPLHSRPCAPSDGFSTTARILCL
jgi:hypothetical protein